MPTHSPVQPEPPSQPSPQAPRRAGGISIGAVLFLLMAAIIVPALVFAVVLLQRNNQAQQSMVTTLAEATSGSISDSVDRQLDGMMTTLRVLSTSPELLAGNLEAFHRDASEALKESAAHLIVADENLNQLFNTRVPFGEPLGRIADPETARHALETGEPAVSNAFIGTTSQRWVFNVILPLGPEIERGRFLILTRDADNLSGSLSSRHLRGGWNVVLLDRVGVVLASSYMSSDIGNPFFLPIERQPGAASIRQPVTFDGRVYETIRSISPVSGWETVVWAPRDVVQAALARSMRMLVLGGLALLAVGAILAWALGRQIARPVRALARDARRLGAGETVEPVAYLVAEIATVSEALAQASQDRQAAENEIRFLMREMAHRSKNQLTVVTSIAKQTARHARTFAAFEDAFQKRVMGLARSTDLLIAGGAAGVDLRALVEVHLEPFAPADSQRVEVDGAPFRLSNQAAQTLGLALHELATNAAKYGAFSTPAGRLAVAWKRSGDDLEFSWREFVPRLRRRAEGRGFGTEVIERMLGGTLAANIEREIHRDGLEARFVMPLERLEPESVATADA